mmetsp:Transcript_83601/g.135547  ORF Transcript_83601/g.135547 Transcript_83601/m.135547 type:complete len:394 (+) Transcript_83601:1-1182(+)
MGCTDEKCDFKPMPMQRRPVGEEDVLIDMVYCGICHTDLHTAAGHLGGIGMKKYPCVPGHELAGICTAVGSKVTLVKVGDQVGVGCMVDSCLNCAACKRGEEQMCSKQVGTYGATDKSGRAATYPAGGHTLGGYTTQMVVHERFAIIIPANYPLKFAGPVMCAGVTLYDPLRRYKATTGTRVAIVGLGGLGQMGVKVAKAMGCVVTVVSRSMSKEKFARECGAQAFLASSDDAQMLAAAKSFDLVMNTIPSEHDYNMYTKLVAAGGKHIILGLNSGLVGAILTDTVVLGNSKVKASAIGSIEATRKVIELCNEHKIYPDIKIVRAEEINDVFTKLDSNNQDGVRYVLDIKGSLNAATASKCTAAAPTIQPSPGITPGLICGTFCNFLCCCKWC